MSEVSRPEGVVNDAPNISAAHIAQADVSHTDQATLKPNMAANIELAIAGIAVVGLMAVASARKKLFGKE